MVSVVAPWPGTMWYFLEQDTTTVPVFIQLYLTIRLRAQVFYEQIFNEAQPS